MSYQEDLVARVKEIQRSDEAGKLAWWQYADSQGSSKRDPSKHEADALAVFVAAYDAGETAGFEPLAKAAGNGGSLGDLFKEGQRSSSSFKDAWATYNRMQGNTTNDPTKADRQTLTAFLEFMGQSAMTAMDNGMGPTKGKSKGGKGAMMGGKGMAGKGKGKAAADPYGMMSQMGGWGGDGGGGMMNDAMMLLSMMGGGGGGGDWGGKGGGKFGGEPAMKMRKMTNGTGNPATDALVATIKQFQRTGEEQKQAWWAFCSSVGGKRDPAGYEPHVLRQFIETMGL